MKKIIRVYGVRDKATGRLVGRPFVRLPAAKALFTRCTRPSDPVELIALEPVEVIPYEAPRK